MEWEDLSLLFIDKSKEKALSKKMKEKFGTFRGAWKLNVTNISDDYVKFSMQLLASKLLRKFCRHQVPARAISTIEKCVKGI
jgi:hypothetical protein